MTPEESIATIRRYWGAWNTGNVAIVDEVMAPSFVFHDTAGRLLHGIETPKNNIIRWRTAFPDSHFTLDDVFAAGDMITVRWTGQAIHQGGINIAGYVLPPTGK